MKSFSADLTPEILSYIDRTFHPEDRILANARTLAEKADIPQIQVGPMDALISK